MKSIPNTPVPADKTKAQYASTSVEQVSEESTAESQTKELQKGNLTVAKDIVSKKNGTREFLTVYSREGDCFYIIIDRDAVGTSNVFFLNRVDDQDFTF